MSHHVYTRERQILSLIVSLSSTRMYLLEVSSSSHLEGGTLTAFHFSSWQSAHILGIQIIQRITISSLELAPVPAVLALRTLSLDGSCSIKMMSDRCRFFIAVHVVNVRRLNNGAIYIMRVRCFYFYIIRVYGDAYVFFNVRHKRCYEICAYNVAVGRENNTTS